MVYMFYIGTNHLGDISDTPAKIISLLQTVDLVIVESGKEFIPFISALEIDIPEYIEFSEDPQLIEHILSLLKKGKDVMILNEMGCPGIADPGSTIIDAVIKENLEIYTVVGPSIPPLALASSGYKSKGFLSIETFHNTDSRIISIFKSAKDVPYPIVILDFKERALDLVRYATEILPIKEVCLCINLGWKNKQKIIKGTGQEILDLLENNDLQSVFGNEDDKPVVTIVFDR
jgi:16S rRNA C1402 (ribose-2'-O) methylase RsmI